MRHVPRQQQAAPGGEREAPLERQGTAVVRRNAGRGWNPVKTHCTVQGQQDNIHDYKQMTKPSACTDAVNTKFSDVSVCTTLFLSRTFQFARYFCRGQFARRSVPQQIYGISYPRLHHRTIRNKIVPAVLNLYVDNPFVQLIYKVLPFNQADRRENRSIDRACLQRIDFLFLCLVDWQYFTSCIKGLSTGFRPAIINLTFIGCCRTLTLMCDQNCLFTRPRQAYLRLLLKNCSTHHSN